MELFTDFHVKNLVIKNRIVMPPMCQYSGDNSGLLNFFHFTHYVTRAIGGVGLIIQEATAVHPRGRITANDLGIWNDGQVEYLKNMVSACQAYGAKTAIQLNHAGRKCTSGEGEIFAPSALKFAESDPTPTSLSVTQIQQIVQDFADAARRADQAGYDVLEIHGAHGYLIHQFLSPLSNVRDDRYGGNISGRARFLLEILEVTRAVWPADKPLFLRVSANDYHPNGIDPSMMVEIINLVKKYVDVVDVSSGGLTPVKVATFPGYQVPLAEKIKHACEIPVIAVGLINNEDMIEEILGNQRADLVAMGRELLRNPYWIINVAAKYGEPGYIPAAYDRAFTCAIKQAPKEPF